MPVEVVPAAVTSEHISVIVGWDGDADAPYARLGDPVDVEDSDSEFAGTIPRELWERVEVASTAWSAAFEAIAAEVGFDGCRLAECCPEWRGHISPGQNWWTIDLGDSGSDDEWPVSRCGGGVMFRHHRSEADAVQDLGDLPDRFFVHHGMGYVEVTKNRLAVVERGYGDSVSGCYRCGWQRSEHVSAGEPIERGRDGG